MQQDEMFSSLMFLLPGMCFSSFPDLIFFSSLQTSSLAVTVQHLHLFSFFLSGPAEGFLLLKGMFAATLSLRLRIFVKLLETILLCD